MEESRIVYSVGMRDGKTKSIVHGPRSKEGLNQGARRKGQWHNLAPTTLARLELRQSVVDGLPTPSFTTMSVPKYK
jgi:hypothetical protein